MKRLCVIVAALIRSLSPARAEECRRVVTPTVIADVAYGDIFLRKAERGMTFRAESCKTRIGKSLYCRMARYRQPTVYLKHADSSGHELTVFRGKNCK